MCGEKNRGNDLKEGKMGSPPHVRGKECRQYMGHLGPVDHPRMCGEKVNKK